MDLEKELERIAQQYRAEGYAVVTHPDKDHLPGFADFGVDLVATRGNEKVLAQVKHTRADVEADSSLSRTAEVTNAQPGWRYDLIVLSEGDPFRRITRGAREPSSEEIDQALAEIDMLLQAGQMRAALVFAWAMLEAAMRQVASSIELHMPKTTPMELLRTLYGNGVMSREEFALLRESFRLRTEIVHGLVSPPVDLEIVRGIVASIRRLLTGKPDAQSAAG
ncbi:MAG: hypothetical protein HYS12_12375 [Planctomycetes bacterium]|nr:hypothetical protein [Planctomycetota bacterium]